MTDEFFLIAEIKDSFGSEGFFSVRSFSDYPDRFSRLSRVFIEIFGDLREFKVDSIVLENDQILLRLENLLSADLIKNLIGKKIFIHRDDSVELPEDTYFVHDLIGSRVLKNDKPFGIIKDVISLTSNDVYVIETYSKTEVLIPAVKDYILSFDDKNKILTLRHFENIYDDED